MPRRIAGVALLVLGVADVAWLNAELLPRAMAGTEPQPLVASLDRPRVAGAQVAGVDAVPPVPTPAPVVPMAQPPPREVSASPPERAEAPPTLEVADPDDALDPAEPEVAPSPPRVFPPLRFNQTGGSRLDEMARDTLEGLADHLTAHPQLDVQLRGHADRRGNAAANRRLARKRAQAARGHLLRLGVARGRISVQSAGADEPEDLSGGPDAWAQNRRVEIRLEQGAR